MVGSGTIYVKKENNGFHLTCTKMMFEDDIRGRFNVSIPVLLLNVRGLWEKKKGRSNEIQCPRV